MNTNTQFPIRKKWGFTATQEDLMRVLLSSPGTIVPTGDLMGRMYGVESHSDAAPPKLKMLITECRKVLYDVTQTKTCTIDSVYGKGYRISKHAARKLLEHAA